MQNELTTTVKHSNIESERQKYESARQDLETRQVYKELSAVKKELCLSFLEPKIRYYEFQTLKDVITVMVLQAQDYCNDHFELDEEALDEFVKDIQRHIPTFTIPELKICFGNGCKCMYGKAFKLSFSVFFQWINIFMMNEDRLKLRKMVERRELPTEKPMLSAEEKEKIVVDSILKSFKSYCDGARGPLVTTTVAYTYLKEIGAIALSKESAHRIQEIAKKELKEEAIRNRGTMPIESAIAQIKKGDIVNASMRKALAEYFDQVKEMGDDLEMIINDCKKEKNEGKEKEI